MINKDNKYLSVSMMAKLFRVSRVTIYNKIKSGQIKAVRIGDHLMIPRKYLDRVLGKVLTNMEKREIDHAIERVFKEYGDVIKRLGND